jgi:hypothetical protein
MSHLDDIVRALAALAVGNDAPLFPAVTVGHAVGAMSVDEAKRFAALCTDYVDGQMVATFRPDGLMALRRVAA